MSSEDTDYIGLELDPRFTPTVKAAVNELNRLNQGILKLDTSKLMSLVDSNNVSGVASSLKDIVKQVKALDNLMQHSGIRSLASANKIAQIQQTYNLASSPISRQAMRGVSALQNPAEIRQFVQAMSVSMQDALSRNNRDLALQLQNQMTQLKSVARHKERIMSMSPQERQAQRAKNAETVQRNQMYRDLSSLINYAQKNQRSSVLSANQDYSQLNSHARGQVRKAQQLHVSQLREEGKDTRAAQRELERLTQAEKDLKAARKEQLRQAKETEAYQRRQQRRDTRASGTFADQYDVRKFENRRTGYDYRIETVNSQGLDKLKEALKAQEKILKLAKDQALQTNKHKDNRIAQLEQARLNRLRREERRYSPIVADNNQLDPDTLFRRSKVSRAVSLNRALGDNGASLFKIQAGLLANYSLMGGGIDLGQNALTFTLDLDRSLRQLQAILALTNGELETLGGHLVNVSEKTKFTALEVVDAATTMGQAGFDPDQIKNSIEATTYLATAIGSDLKTAVDLQTSVMGIYDKSSSEMMDVSDKIVTAINTSKLNLEKLTLGMQYSGNISAQLGVTFEENVAALAAMANSGIRSGSTLGTGMRQIYTALQKPSASFSKWMEDAGLSFEDVDVKARGLYNVLATLRDAGFDMNKASKMWETRAATAVGAVMNNMSEFKDMMESFDTSAGSAMAANEKQMEATRNQLERLYSILGTLASDGLEPLREVFTIIVKEIADGLSYLREMETTVKVITTLLVGAGAGRALGWFGGLIKNLGLLGGVTKLGTASKAKYYGKIGKSNKKTDDSIITTAANVGLIAQMLKGALSGSRAGLWGAAAGGTAAAAVWYFDEQRKNADILDKANTRLSENLTLYTDQTNAIRKVNKTLYEMEAKQSLYRKDTEAMSRLSKSLQTEFGGLGLQLTGLDSDFDSTKSSLIAFRDALDTAAAANFPKQSYQDVTSALQKNYGGLDTVDERFFNFSILGKPYAKVDPTAQNEEWAINLKDTADFWQNNPDRLSVLNAAKPYFMGTDNLNLQDSNQVNLALAKLGDASELLKFMKRTELSEGTHRSEAVEKLYNVIASRMDVLTQASSNLRAQNKEVDNLALQRYQTTIFDKYSARASDLTHQYHALVGNNAETLASNAPIVEKKKFIQEQIVPLQDAAERLLQEIRGNIIYDDSQNGTNYADSLGQFQVISSLQSLITGDMSDKVNVGKKLNTKWSKRKAQSENQMLSKQLQAVQGRISFATKESELNDILDQLLSLSSDRSKLKLVGETPNTEAYQLLDLDRQEALKAEHEKLTQAVNAKRYALQNQATQAAARDNNLYGTIAGKHQNSAINLLASQLRSATDLDTVAKLEKEYIAAIQDRNRMEKERALSKLSPDSSNRAGIELLFDDMFDKDSAKAGIFTQQIRDQVAKGIFKANEKAMQSLLKAENSGFQAYMKGQKFVNSSDKALLNKEYRNQLLRLKDKHVSEEDIGIISGLLDEIVVRAIEAKAKGIEQQVQDPTAKAQLLSNLDEEKRLQLDRNNLVVHARKMRRLDALSSMDNEAYREWKHELDNSWSIEKKGIQERKNLRTAEADSVQNTVTSNQEFGTVLKGQLDIDKMPPAFYKQLQTSILDFSHANNKLLQDSYTQQINETIQEQNRLSNLKSMYNTRMLSDEISPRMRDDLQKKIADVDVELSKLEKDVEDTRLKASELAVTELKEDRELQNSIRNKTDFSGRYQSIEYRNRSAQISGGDFINPANGEMIPGSNLNPDIEKLNGVARAWEQIKVAAQEYGNEMSRSYDNFDPMVEAVEQLKNATDQAIQKTASLFSEWALGTKSSKDAFAELGQFVLQTLSQIAFQIAMTKMTDAVVGMFATGGSVPKGSSDPKIKRATGGRIPHFAGGGKVTYSGYGSRGQDSVIAKVMPDEFILRSHVARDWGNNTLNAINNGQLKPEDLQKPNVQQQINQGPEALNVWIVAKPEDAGNGGIGPHDVVAIVEDNIMRKGSLRTLVKQISLTK